MGTSDSQSGCECSRRGGTKRTGDRRKGSQTTREESRECTRDRCMRRETCINADLNGRRKWGRTPPRDFGTQPSLVGMGNRLPDQWDGLAIVGTGLRRDEQHRELRPNREGGNLLLPQSPTHQPLAFFWSVSSVGTSCTMSGKASYEVPWIVSRGGRRLAPYPDFDNMAAANKRPNKILESD